ncbi:DUF1028 domain-containing protein [Sphingobium lactosutens]|uniref:DUF1028 domain-containing protein n=1 Tax=Sphingobium lactosutens TaxID=522773 RepID=UPI0015BCFF82|nr:DUF1028 domain-containing protein [Sphingobium lactosutens]NWK96556.1 DUF1028 domain-containing protein [Sphingobium lactosutens]
MKPWIGAVWVAAMAMPTQALATFSIIACDAEQSCGAAVATNNLAVGASVIDAQAGVGAIASQFETNPGHATEAFRQLKDGRSADDALKAVLAADGNFEDQDIGYRQVGLVAARGRGAAYSGVMAQQAAWAGVLTGDGYSIQGNGLAGAQVLTAMRDRFLTGKGPLADRLMAAIEAGEAAGGQTSGRLSAALLVRTVEGGWQDIDLRVDASATPLADLRQLFGMQRANEALGQAERAWRQGDKAKAGQQMAKAAELAPHWDRIWRRIARLSLTMGDLSQARTAFGTFAGLNPAWAQIERSDAFYAPIIAMESGSPPPGVSR